MHKSLRIKYFVPLNGWHISLKPGVLKYDTLLGKYGFRALFTGQYVCIYKIENNTVFIYSSGRCQKELHLPYLRLGINKETHQNSLPSLENVDGLCYTCKLYCYLQILPRRDPEESTLRQTVTIPPAEIDRQLALCDQIHTLLEDRPGQKLAFVDTYGCQQNEADSERLRGYLARDGLRLFRHGRGGRPGPAQHLRRAGARGAAGLWQCGRPVPHEARGIRGRSSASAAAWPGRSTWWSG